MRRRALLTTSFVGDSGGYAYELQIYPDWVYGGWSQTAEVFGDFTELREIILKIAIELGEYIDGAYYLDNIPNEFNITIDDYKVSSIVYLVDNDECSMYFGEDGSYCYCGVTEMMLNLYKY